jgi:Raf kinase inhibitor-like YbhB/YbcL family protein
MIKKISIALLILLTLAISTKLTIVFLQQKADFDFHATLPKTIELSSDDFVENGMIPITFTGRGENRSPSLHWNNLPKGTRSLVLLMTDYDAPAPFLKFTTVGHWVVYNVPADKSGFEKGTTSAALQKDSIRSGENYTGGVDYAGPKPPVGVHNYYFRIYALSTSNLNLTKAKRQAVMEAMKGTILGYGELIGKF